MNGEASNMFLCRDVVENILDYIDAELDYKTMLELESHLDECPECEAFVKTYRRMLELTGKLRERSFVTKEVRSRLRNFLISSLNPN